MSLQSQEDGRKCGAEQIFEVTMTEDCKFGKIDPRSSVNPKRINSKKTHSQCIIIKWLKTKEKRKYLESSQRKTVYFIIWITSDFFSETVEVKSKKNNILKC